MRALQGAIAAAEAAAGLQAQLREQAALAARERAAAAALDAAMDTARAAVRTAARAPLPTECNLACIWLGLQVMRVGVTASVCCHCIKHRRRMHRHWAMLSSPRVALHHVV